MTVAEHVKPGRKDGWKRRWWILVLVLLLLLGIISWFLPYLLKRYVEQHSEEWIGRRVTIGSIILDPFSRTFGLTDVVCREPGSEERFVAWQKASVRWDLWAWWRHDAWRFHQVELRAPYVHVVQQGDRFNFSDLLELGASAPAEPADTTPVVFSMEDLMISDGEVMYASDLLKEPMVAEAVQVRCSRITSETGRMDLDLDLRLRSGGSVTGAFMIDTDRELYGIDARLRGLDLEPLLPYAQDLLDCRSLTGMLDVDLDLIDSWTDTSALALRTTIDLNDLELQDGASRKLLGLKNGHCSLDTLSARSALFHLRNLSLDGAYARYESFADSTDNWTRALRSAGAVVDSGTVQLSVSESNVFLLLADYIAMLGREFIANEYNADSLSLTDGTIDLADHTMSRPFTYRIEGLGLRSTRVTTEQPTASMAVSALLNGSGIVTGDLVIDPREFKDMELALSVDRLALRDLDPYMRWYAAHPLMDGVLGYTSTTTIAAGRLDSKNHLRVDRMAIGKRTDDHAVGIPVLPLRLAVGLLKDPKGLIDLDVPVSGDLKDPNFKPWPIVWQVLKNLLLKAVAAPANLLARAVGGAEGDLEAVRFEPMQAVPARAQLHALQQLAAALAAKPGLAADLVPLVDSAAEREELALFVAKRMCLFGERTDLAAADTLRLLAFSPRDSSFTRFLDLRSPGTRALPLHERCASVAGAAEVNRLQSDIEYARREHIMQWLLARNVPAARVRFREGTRDELATWKGAPGYRFVFDAAP